MEISHSKLAFSKKQALLKEYPGLKRHFAELENVIKENPAAGSSELMANYGGRATPVLIMSAKTEIFGGAAAYSKELTAVYVCSEDISTGRILQFIF